MMTARDAILAILAMLDTAGPQGFDDLLLECRVQLADPPTAPAVRQALAQMIEAGEVFTDGQTYSRHAEDFGASSLIHFSTYLLQAFDPPSA